MSIYAINWYHSHVRKIPGESALSPGESTFCSDESSSSSGERVSGERNFGRNDQLPAHSSRITGLVRESNMKYFLKNVTLLARKLK